MRRRRIMTVVVATVMALMLFTGTAFAHFCFVPNRSEQGNAGAANSQAWIAIGELLALEFGLCEEGARHVEEVFLAPRGASLSTLIHTQALMGQGVFGSELMSNGTGVDHLFNSEKDFEEFFETFVAASELC